MILIALGLALDWQPWAGDLLTAQALGQLRQPVLGGPGGARQGHGSEALQMASKLNSFNIKQVEIVEL